MNLYVDIGNSRCKLRSGSTGPVTVLASTEGEITAGIAMIAGRGGAPLRILVSSVAGPGPADELVRACRQHWKLEPEFLSVQDGMHGLRLAYANPSGFGIDRWLGILAAREKFPEHCIVVDAGTALTADIIHADGRHLGGYIVPGLGLMRAALAKGTARLDVPLPSAHSLQPGRDTASAISNGTLSALAAMITELPQLAGFVRDETVQLVLTGGDAGILSGVLSLPHHLEPNLVLDGMILVEAAHA